MNDFDDIIKNVRPTLVDFFATWCGPCKVQSPILDELEEKVGDKIKILKLDIDKHDDIASEYNIQSVPTLILFREGKILWRSSGVKQLDFLEARIKELLG